MEHERDELDDLFQRYAAACPVPEAGTDFMPRLWRRIEERESFSFSFAHLWRAAATAAAGMVLLLAVMNLSHNPYSSVLSYPDALAASHSAEGTLFADGAR